MIKIVTEADKATYENRMSAELLVPGDLIISGPNTKAGDVVSWNMTQDFPDIREGANVWTDGQALFEKSPNAQIILRGGGQDHHEWPIKNATIRPIPGAAVQVRGLDCHGLLNLNLPGVDEKLKGLAALDHGAKFLTNNFGFKITGEPDRGHGLDVSAIQGGKVTGSGIECLYGFSGLRLQKNARSIDNSFEFENCYLHDIGRGETVYGGNTKSAPAPSPRLKVKFKNIVIARPAAEGLQLGQLFGSDIRNITQYAVDCGWMAEFGDYQDTATQWKIWGGNNLLENILTYGFGSMGLNAFGNDRERVPGIAHANNLAFIGGRHTLMYLQKSASYGIDWKFTNIYLAKMVSDYVKYTGSPDMAMISRKHGSDPMLFDNIYHDSDKSPFESVKDLIVQNVFKKDLPEPKFINSGFYEPAHRIQQWHQFYKWHPISAWGKLVPTVWNQGDIAIDHLERKFYKCKFNHASTEKRPKDSENFIPLTWDENGIRSDQGELFTSTSKQVDYPPDDLRLADDDLYRSLGIGYIHAPAPTKDPVIEDFFYSETRERVTVTKSGKVYKQKY